MPGFSAVDSDPAHPGVVCLLLDPAGRVRWSNRAAKATASAASELEILTDLIHIDDHDLIGDLLDKAMARGCAAGIIRIKDPSNGSIRHFHFILAVDADTPMPTCDSIVAGPTGTILAQAWDVTALIRERQEAEVFAFRDPLTGVANRRTFMTMLDQEMQAAHRSRAPVAVMFADVDDFKRINDVYGHQGGDQVLIQLVNRLSGRLRPEDTLARIGGDEFAIICPNLNDWAAASVIVERLRHAAAEPITISRGEIGVTLSIGVAFAEEAADHGSAAAHLLALADRRMFRAKFAAKGQEEQAAQVR